MAACYGALKGEKQGSERKCKREGNMYIYRERKYVLLAVMLKLIIGFSCC